MLRRADEEVARRIGDAERSAGRHRRGPAGGRPASWPVPGGGGGDPRRGREAPGRGRRRPRRPTAESIAAERGRRGAGDRPRHRARRAGAHVGMGGVGAPARDGRGGLLIAMDQRRAEALTAIRAERVRTDQWVQHSKDEATRQARAEIAAAEETARRMIAEAQAKVAELADLRARIAAQLRGTQAQLGTALDDLAPRRCRRRPHGTGRPGSHPRLARSRPPPHRPSPAPTPPPAPAPRHPAPGRPAPTSPSTPRRPSRSPGPCCCPIGNPGDGRGGRTTTRRTCPGHAETTPPRTGPRRSRPARTRRPSPSAPSQARSGARRSVGASARTAATRR